MKPAVCGAAENEDMDKNEPEHHRYPPHRLRPSYHGQSNSNRPHSPPVSLLSKKLSHVDECDEAEGHRAVQGASAVG